MGRCNIFGPLCSDNICILQMGGRRLRRGFWHMTAWRYSAKILWNE